jgi:hypothetical protein
MKRVKRISVIPPYQLRIEFDDGVAGTIDLSTRLFGEMFEPLRDETMFRKASIDEYGAVYWPNGADLAPDALYRQVLGLNVPSVTSPG